MEAFDERSRATATDEEDDDPAGLEETDIESDEVMDGEVDAEGASAIPRRDE